ncbi:MAG: hypothetical protein BYD32DRAFT_365557, partial [Podila humilis]
WVDNPTLTEFCFSMTGRADIKKSTRNVAMNARLLQASYSSMLSLGSSEEFAKLGLVQNIFLFLIFLFSQGCKKKNINKSVRMNREKRMGTCQAVGNRRKKSQRLNEKRGIGGNSQEPEVSSAKYNMDGIIHAWKHFIG